MTIQAPQHVSLAAPTTTVPLPAPTQPTEPGPGLSLSSTATSSTAPRPAPTTFRVNPGPTDHVQSEISRHRSRWGWISRYPVAGILSIILLLILTLVTIMITRLNINVQPLYEQIPYNMTGIAVTGHNYQLDLGKRTLSIVWEISGCGDYRLSTYQSSEFFGASTTCGPFYRPVDIYMNSFTTPVFSYDPADLPVNPTEGALYMTSLLTFQMDHRMDVYSGSIYFPGQNRHYFDQQLTAPFDDYTMRAVVFVIDKATNESVYINRFAAADPVENFVTFSRDQEATNKFTYEAGNGTVTVDVQSRTLVVKINQSILAQAFTMCMMLVNWALTVGTVYITIVTLVRREKIRDSVLVLPITMVVTIPAIRNLFVGSPPFGILLDIVGFFLQILLVALSSLVLLFVVVEPSGSDQLVPGDSEKPGGVES